jgi:nitrogen regulatory protein P-II 2
MQTTTLKLVTIFAEGVLESHLLNDLLKLGARGYTVSNVRGRGTRGIETSHWEGAQVKIETIVSPEVANRILEHLSTHYFADYAVAAYVEQIEVVRGEKYL